jgi:DNA-binding MarR family transcriptional regulator
MQLSDDVIARLGYLVLGTRLKRLAEQLQSGVAEMLVELGSPLQPGQLPLLVAIDQGDGLTIAQLVQAIGTSQPAVSRTLAALQREGLVSLEADADDARVRRPVLTASARHLLDAVRSRLFPAVAGAAEQLCDGLGVLETLATLEQRNREQPFAQRIRAADAG